MNDELTPDERAALRARIVGGARGIKPVGAHRNAWIAGSIAAALVIAIAGGVAATSTLSAPEIATTPSPSPTAVVEPTPLATPTPTPEPVVTPTQAAPTTPVVAFGGDCGRVLSEDEAAGMLVGGGAVLLPEDDLATNTAGSLALLGGLSCTWVTEGDAITVVVTAADAVSPDLVASTSSVTCSSDRGCELGRVTGDMWVGVHDSTYPDGVDAGFTAQQIADATDRFERVIALVAGRAHTAPVSSIASVRPGAWTLSDCLGLQARLEEVTGIALTMQPRPGDGLPFDPLVDAVITGSAGVTQCTYRDADDGRGAITVTLMPGASTPPSAVLGVAGTSETTVDGADRAWVQVPYDHVYALDLAATVGADRLTLKRMTAQPAVTDAERIAATVIAFVEGR